MKTCRSVKETDRISAVLRLEMVFCLIEIHQDEIIRIEIPDSTKSLHKLGTMLYRLCLL